MEKEKIPDAIRNIDKKMARMFSFAKKKNLDGGEREKFIKEEFVKACNLYGITEEEYIDYTITNYQ